MIRFSLILSTVSIDFMDLLGKKLFVASLTIRSPLSTDSINIMHDEAVSLDVFALYTFCLSLINRHPKPPGTSRS